MDTRKGTGEMAQTTRLRTSADVFYVASDQGAWLRNSKGSLTIRGQDAYPVLEWLLPQLDGYRELQDVLDGLAPPRRQVVQRLLDGLIDQGFVQVIPEHRSEPPNWVRELYDEQFTFLDHHCPDPTERFAAFRGLPAVAIGRGSPLRALVTALCEMGVGQLSVNSLDGAPDEELDDLVASAMDRDRGLHAAITDSPSVLGDAVRKAAADGVQLVAVAAESLPLDEVAALSAWPSLSPAPAPPWLGVLTTWNGLAVSLITAGDPCVPCVDRAFAGGALITGEPAPPPAVAIAAHDIALGLFLNAVGLAEGSPLATVDGTDLSMRRHRVPRHPDCPRCRATAQPDAPSDQPTRPVLAQPRPPEDLTLVQDTIVDRVARLTDPVVGPLLNVGEGDLPQVPLASSGCTVRTRSSCSAKPLSLRLCVVAADSREARNQVVLTAAERWMADGEPPSAEAGVVCAPGAGWSEAEATYRALAGAGARWAELTDTSGGRRLNVSAVGHPLVRHLRELLTDYEAPVSEEVWRRDTSTGLVAVTLESRDVGTAAAVGLAEGDAIANALLTISVRAGLVRASGVECSAALVPPDTDTWAAATEAALAAVPDGRVRVLAAPAPLGEGPVGAWVVVR